MEIRKQSLFIFALSALLFASQAFCQSASLSDSFVQGLVSYRSREWGNASVFLHQAVEQEDYDTDSTWYMIIMSRIYSGEYSLAVNDCDYFISSYPESELLEAVEYQKGRALHCSGQNDSAVMTLGSFCNEYPESNMYPSALFWIAECFYDDYDFETARALYERIVSEWPSSAKAEDAEFKLYLISQRDREQKLLYLLKMTGEEYLSAKEGYERELSTMRVENVAELRRQLSSANSRIQELEETLVPDINSVEMRSQNYPASGGTNEEMYSLKEKAALIQKLLDERYGGKQ